MANFGFNQFPTEPGYNVADPVGNPQIDKNPARTVSRRKIAQACKATLWRLPDPLIEGFRTDPSVNFLLPSHMGNVGALCQFLIDNSHKALLTFGGQLVPNNAAWRAATGGDSAWTQVNFSHWHHAHMPSGVWPVRWAYQKIVFDYYKAYFAYQGRDWSRYIEFELANEKGVITTPAAVSTTVSGSHSIGATTLNVASAAAFNAGEYVTVQGAGAWQSFQIASKGATTLNVQAGTCSSDYGLTTSDGLAVAVSGGVTVTRAAYQSSYFGQLASNEYDELSADAIELKAAYPEVFLWGPGLSGGHPSSIDAMFDSGGAFLTRIGGVNYHCYAKSGTYGGDEQWHGLPVPGSKGPDSFARDVAAPHAAIIRKYRTRTALQIACTECGWAPSTALYGQTGNRAYGSRLFAQEWDRALAGVLSLDLRHLIYWGPDRSGLGDNVNTMDLITPEGSMNSSAALLMHSALAMRRSGVSAATVPSGFANAGAATGFE